MVSSFNKMECAICFEDMTKEFRVITPCNHEICFKCLLRLYELKCPLCRENFRSKIPASLMPVFLQNARLERSRTGSLNIYNTIDFPPLGS